MNILEIEFIEMCIPYAAGFELNGDQLIFPESGIETLNENLLNLRVWKLVWLPLLLQKTIEGINKIIPTILQSYDEVVSYAYECERLKSFRFGKGYSTVEEAKKASLIYFFICEKRDKNGR